MEKLKKICIKNLILSFSILIIVYLLSWLWINYANEKSVKFVELDKDKINIKLLIWGHHIVFME